MFYFQQYPSLLALAFDMRRSVAERRATLPRSLNADACCLDQGLCAPLQAHTDNIEYYLVGVLCDFLVTLYERVVVTSTQVELLFASLSKFTSNSHGGAGPATLAAKYMLNAFSRAVERWRKEQHADEPG